jgi:hypothetical protein
MSGLLQDLRYALGKSRRGCIFPPVVLTTS